MGITVLILPPWNLSSNSQLYTYNPVGLTGLPKTEPTRGIWLKVEQKFKLDTTFGNEEPNQ